MRSAVQYSYHRFLEPLRLPGAPAHAPEELDQIARLVSLSSTAEAVQETFAFKADYGRDVYDFFVNFIRHERISAARGNTCCIILVGRFLVCVYNAALLANVASFSVNDGKVNMYVQRIVLSG